MDIIEHLRLNDAFAQLDSTVLQQIASVCRITRISRDQMIVREGDKTADLFVLVEGTVSIVRAGATGERVAVSSADAGECLGELAFLDGEPRAATVVAVTPCTLVEIPAAGLKSLPDGAAVSGELKAALASVVVKRARRLSDDMLSTLRAQLAAKTLQNQFGYFLVFTIALFLISTTLFYLVAEHYVEDVYDPGFSWQTVLLLAVPCLVIIRVLRIPADQLGLRRQGLLRSLAQSFAICLGLTIPALVYLWFFRGTQGSQSAGAQIDLVFLAQYLVHTVFQEIGSRGLLQGLFQKFLDDTKGHRAILLTSTIFASLHLTFGVDAVAITFFASILFGYVYLYQKNLAGVILMHYWFGVLAAFIVAI